jgi:hypothetical protein
LKRWTNFNFLHWKYARYPLQPVGISLWLVKLNFFSYFSKFSYYEYDNVKLRGLKTVLAFCRQKLYFWRQLAKMFFGQLLAKIFLADLPKMILYCHTITIIVTLFSQYH